MVITDNVGAHEPIKETPTLEFKPRVQKGRRFLDHVYEWSDKQKVVTGKVSLIDYEHLTPKTKLTATTILKKGTHTNNDLEVYAMGGHYTTASDGEGYTRVRAERAAQDYESWSGAGNARTLVSGGTFKLKDHPRVTGDNDFLIVKAEHYFQIEVDKEGGELEQFVVNEGLTFPGNDDLYFCRFDVIRKATPFRPPAVTPWPDLSGLHTAVVTGPGGEEIYTNEHGQVKVQFHWDRHGKHDDKTTCWCRVAHPWTGKGYGMQSIPRMGQEVVIMFERNNPDRPVIIGMLYNAVNTPPYSLPANMTQTGIKSKSSKGGGGFNELVMEDKKGEEFVRLQSEKDYIEIIKNNAKITIGLEKADAGDMSLEVKNDQAVKIGHDQTIDVGNDRTLTVGNNESISIGANQTTTIGKDSARTIGNNETVDIATNLTETVGSNHEQSVGASQTFSIGANQSTTIGAKGEFEAATSYEIKVGASSIKIEPSKITIKSMSVVIDAAVSFKAKGGLTAVMEGGASAKVKAGAAATLQGGAMATVKGGVVKIN